MSKVESNYFFFIIFLFIPIFHFLEPSLSNNFKNQFLIFFAPLVWPGVAHGSLDFLIAKRLGIIETLIKKVIFLFIYIFLAVFYALLWIKAPEFCLTTFLLISIFHFGLSDSLIKNKIGFLEIFIRGSIPISFPIYYFGDQVSTIFTHLYVDKFFFEEIKIIFIYLYFFIHLCIIFFFLIYLEIMKVRKVILYRKFFYFIFVLHILNHS